MKKMRRFAALAAAAAMTACMAVPMMAGFTASAADETFDITINNDTAGHTYKAYQIFTGTLTGGILTDIVWGSGVSDTAKTALGDAPDVAGDLSVAADADALATVLVETEGYLGTVAATDNDGTDGYVLADLAPGYYLIVDTTSVNGKDDTVTKYIMKVSETTGVDPKTDMPTLEKKIWHDDVNEKPEISTEKAPEISATTPAAGWNDVGDNQIGDTVYYLTKTSVPDMQHYDTYKYIIHDTMSNGLTPGAVTNIVYIDVDGAPTVIPFVTTPDTDAATVNAVVSGQTLTVDFGDLKTILDNAAKGGYIYTYYTATLDADAQVSASTNGTQNNPNTAYLEYSNNPNASGSGDTSNTGRTEDDTVYDWTFTYGVEKTDGEGIALAGAGFTLYDAADNAINLVAVDATNVNGGAAEKTLYYRVATTGDTDVVTQIVTTEEANKFVILGLDDSNTYTLKETKVPGGYNTCDPVTVDLNTNYDNIGSSLTALTNGTGTEANSTTIKNYMGQQLPSTGGIGTTIFYVVGGTMVAGAGVALIVKKRMKNED